MACGCQKVCIKGGTVEIDTTTPLDVNIINSAPIAVQGANNDPFNVLIVNPTPLSVYGSGGAPVDVNIVSPDPVTVDGSVSITGTPSVSISGTPAVTATVSGTVAVSAVSGTVATNAVKGTASGTTAAPTTGSAQIVASNASRKSLIIYNNGTQTVYLRPQATASAANGLPLAAGTSFVDDASTNAWHAVAASGTGDLRIIEVS